MVLGRQSLVHRQRRGFKDIELGFENGTVFLGQLDILDLGQFGFDLLALLRNVTGGDRDLDGFAIEILAGIGQRRNQNRGKKEKTFHKLIP